MEGTCDPLAMNENQGLQDITFVDFVNGMHLELFVETAGKEEVAKVAVEVLTRIQNAGLQPWLHALGQTSGWQLDPSKLLRAIAANEMCCHKHMRLGRGECGPHFSAFFFAFCGRVP